MRTFLYFVSGSEAWLLCSLVWIGEDEGGGGGGPMLGVTGEERDVRLESVHIWVILDSVLKRMECLWYCYGGVYKTESLCGRSV